MSLITRFRYRIHRRWWQFRHEVYYYVIPVSPVSPTGGDDTAMIQNAINEASRTPEWFTDISSAYQSKWYRFLLRKPILNASTLLQAGTYRVGTSLMIGDNVTIQGQESEHTTIEKHEEQEPT